MLIKKWLLFTTLLVLLTVLQCSKCLVFFNVKPALIFPLAIGFFMFNSTKDSCSFAVISGFFMDCFSERALGFSSLFLLASCIATLFFCKKFIRIKFLNFILLNTTFFITFELLNFIILFFSLKFINIWPLWFSHIFPTCALTTLFSPIFYLICKQIHKIFNKKKLVTTY